MPRRPAWRRLAVAAICGAALAWSWWQSAAGRYAGLPANILGQVIGDVLLAGLALSGLSRFEGRTERPVSATMQSMTDRDAADAGIHPAGASDSFAQVVRQLREQAGLSLAALSARSQVSKSHIGNMELGVRKPTPAIVRALDTALQADGFLIAIAGEADPVKRRSLIAGLSLGVGSIAARPVGAFSESVRQSLMASLDASDDDWHAIADAHGHDYMRVSAPEMHSRLIRDLAALRSVLPDSPRLWSVACRLSALEAMTLTSLGHKSEGDRWWRTARLAGSRSASAPIAAWLRGREAFRAAHEEADPLHVLRMAADVDDPEAHLARAWAHARLGQHRDTAAAVDAAHACLARLPQTSEPTMFQIPAWRLSLAASRAFALLGETTSMRSTLVDIPPTMREWVAHREICVALAESTTGDRASGMARAEAALAALPEVSRVSVVRNLVREVGVADRRR